MHLFLPCPRGLEIPLSTELLHLGAHEIKETAGGVACQGDWDTVYRLNLHSRIASRVLVQVAHGAYRSEQDLYQAALRFEWEDWFGPDKTLRVDTTAVQSPLKSPAFVTLKVKDAICDRLRQKYQSRPDIDTVQPDVRVVTYLFRQHFTLYIDTSGESLFKRGWRLEKGEAPLRENLAAGILMLADWQPGIALFDPMCGSGTLLVEAAQQCLAIAPGIARHFGFQALRNFDLGLWQAQKAKAHSEAAQTNGQDHLAMLSGSDISGDMLVITRANLERAGIPLKWLHTIELKQVEAQFIQPPAPAGILVTNPPYGSRLSVRGDSNLDTDERYLNFFRAFAQTLKQHFNGWQVYFLSADRDLPKWLRLRESRKVPLFNGALECRLFRFEIVAGSHRERPSPPPINPNESIQ